MNDISLEQILLIASGISVVFATFALLSLLRRPKFSGVVLLVFAPLSVGFVILTQDVFSYRNLADEQRVARVIVTLDDADGVVQAFPRYTLSLSVPEQETRHFTLLGDQWQLEGRVLRWDLPFARLGVTNLVKLERLSNRYQNINFQRQEDKIYYAITSTSLVDTWPILRKAEFLKEWVEVDYGNAVFAPLTDGAAYGVFLGRSGLFIRPDNPIASKSLKDWSA
ncbi:hypothetical protein IB286_12830 [Spongiibacter sp. KMU-158]|uniref:Multidrug transporter n=1 Tax=Spongiibacter pelagi TaxID=2760804 RepID=A0A927C4S3_9GAMM|nr:hypothetical protein [Spongiibacter pelagi]MBD2859887.1 hypothetical protein [Spongiibacter pelagi]